MRFLYVLMVIFLLIFCSACGGRDSGSGEAENNAPVASDAVVSTEAGKALDFELPWHDPDNDIVNFTVDYTSLVGGTVLNHNDGTFTYYPLDGFTGSDAFSVHIEDIHGGFVDVQIVVKVLIGNSIFTDSDNDGLTDIAEREIYFTSPAHEDTDGDGLSDGREVIALGFNPLQDRFRFNPNVADLPKIGIKLLSAPVITLHYTTGETLSTGQSQQTATTSSVSFSNQFAVGIEASVEHSTGTDTSTEVGVKASFTYTHNWTTEQAEEHRKIFETGKENSKDFDGGDIKVLINIVNEGDIAFTLSNLLLTAIIPDRDMEPGSLIPIANLVLDNKGFGFPEMTLGPGEEVEGLVFGSELDLGTALQLLADSGALVLKPSSFELTDDLGRAMDHNLTAVLAKTTLVTIDYGPGDLESHYVAANDDYYTDPSMYGIYVRKLLGDDTSESPFGVKGLLGTSLTLAGTDLENSLDNQPFSLRGMENGASSAEGIWKYHTNSDEFTSDASDILFDTLRLQAGDRLSLVYAYDSDGDGLGVREELLWGCSDENVDSDGDGSDMGILTDFNEVRGWPQTDDVETNKIWFTSNPILVDSDLDGLTDLEEYLQKDSSGGRKATDPMNKDTDGDGLSDGIDRHPATTDVGHLVTLNVQNLEFDPFEITLSWTMPLDCVSAPTDSCFVRNIVITGRPYDVVPYDPPAPPDNPNDISTWLLESSSPWHRWNFALDGSSANSYTVYPSEIYPDGGDWRQSSDWVFHAYVMYESDDSIEGVQLVYSDSAIARNGSTRFAFVIDSVKATKVYDIDVSSILGSGTIDYRYIEPRRSLFIDGYTLFDFSYVTSQSMLLNVTFDTEDGWSRHVWLENDYGDGNNCISLTGNLYEDDEFGTDDPGLYFGEGKPGMDICYENNIEGWLQEGTATEQFCETTSNCSEVEFKWHIEAAPL